MSRYYYAQYERIGRSSQSSARPGGTGRNGAPPSAECADPYAVLWLRTGAPPEVIRAAYRVLAARLHPDAGGSEAAMRRLNAAYHQLRASGRVT